MRNCIEKAKHPSANLPPSPLPPEPFTESRPEELAPAYQYETRIKPNPEYALRVEKRKAVNAEIIKYKTFLGTEETKLAQIKSEANIGAQGYVGSTAVGAWLGAEVIGGFWGAVFGGALGAGLDRRQFYG